jgi:hypothetical protein
LAELKKIRIGCGAGFSGDRIEPAVILVDQADLDYLVLECLAERTIALAQKRKLLEPDSGYDPLLERRIGSLLPQLIDKDVRLITNMGAANPVAAAKKIVDMARSKNLKIKVAAVSGDDVLQWVNDQRNVLRDIDNGRLITEYDVISANAYLGVDAILPALESGAHIIITGRVADPSLFLAPMIHELKWARANHEMMGKGTITGHLLECAGQVTGGYFADPVHKPVLNMEALGHPFADIFPDGSSIISKVAGTGGRIDLQTVKEQLLYEVVNPYEYITPDVVADITTVQLQQVGEDSVSVSGGSGKERPAMLKASVGYKAFYLGEAEISYAGPSCLERAELAGRILERRLKDKVNELTIDFIGLNASFRRRPMTAAQPAPEVRLRVAGKSQNAADAALVGEEVEALYTNGPAAGGGVRKNVTDVIGIVSVLVDRNAVTPTFKVFES